MLLKIYDDVLELYRNQKKIYAKFLCPHRVISTCRINGGLREDITAMLNHQSCEPCNHMGAHTKRIIHDPQGYLDKICSEEGLDSKHCASLGTAANMNFAAIHRKKFKDLWVLSVATGGVETNAGRAGDPASFHENKGRWIDKDDIKKIPGPGTINIMIFINKTLSKGALTRAIITATEAKTAVLQELAVNSRYSSELATGTGTDQMGIASKLTDEPELTSSGKHTKLGELIGKTVKKAVSETLALQNGLTPMSQRSVKIHMERFGTDKKDMLKNISLYLNDNLAKLLNDNFESLDKDPMIVAAVAAMVHLRDKGKSGILPQNCMQEIFLNFGVEIAMAVSGKTGKTMEYKDKLSGYLSDTSDQTMVLLIFKALAMGFEDKWKTN